jgi:opacity protein-like surface antigen
MIFTQLIKSIDDHWSYGASAILYSSTYDNANLFTTIGPAIEYNIFPYDQATRRELRIQYRLDFSVRNYDEMTIYDKTKENLFSQQLQVVWEMKEPWGSLGVQLRGSTFLHDWSKNNLQFEAGISLRVFKGLSFNIEGEYSRVRDQLALPKRDTSVEEILLEIRRLATSYDLRLQMGFSFRFGSIYSNVVNPRFGNR